MAIERRTCCSSWPTSATSKLDAGSFTATSQSKCRSMRQLIHTCEQAVVLLERCGACGADRATRQLQRVLDGLRGRVARALSRPSLGVERSTDTLTRMSTC